MAKGQVIKYLDLMEIDGDEQVVLVLAPKNVRTSNRRKRFVIQEKNLWRYTKEHNPDFAQFMMGICLQVWDLFDLGIPNTRQLAELAEVIQDGIVEMMDAVPDSKSKADSLIVGEAEIIINGQRRSAELTESGLIIL